MKSALQLQMSHSPQLKQIHCQTPLRVSLFGGGTDYPEYFKRHPGAVLGLSIDKYIHLHAHEHIAGVGPNYRLSHFDFEEVSSIDEIQHPIFREALRLMQLPHGWSFYSHSDLPGRSGLGSSSSFAVGLLNVLYYLRGASITPKELLDLAAHLERDILGGGCGIQDHMHASIGGLKRYDFGENHFTSTPIAIAPDVKNALNQSMFLVHTGISRYANVMVGEQVKKTQTGLIDDSLAHLYQLVIEGQKLLESPDPEYCLKTLGAMLHDGWQTKRALSSQISSKSLDEIYDAVCHHGAYGGKLCGAGGGGFFFFIVPQHSQKKLIETLKYLNFIPVRISEVGTRIVS